MWWDYYFFTLEKIRHTPPKYAKSKKIGSYPVLCGSKLNKKNMVLIKYPKDPCDQTEDGAGKNSDPTLSALISTLSHQPCSPPYTQFTCICVKEWMFQFNLKHFPWRRGWETELLTFRRKRGNNPIGSLLSRGEQGKYGGKRGKETEWERRRKQGGRAELCESEVTARGFIKRGQEPATGKKPFVSSKQL